MDSVELKINLKNFTTKMMRELNKHDAKVGLLADEKHEDDDFSIAELGAVHEFGSLSGDIPKRSFLRLTSEKKAEEMSAFITENEPAIVEACINGQMKAKLKLIAMKFEEFVHECFETEGWGTWDKLEKATLIARERKRFKEGQGGVMILQDTGALERSINHEVK